MNVFLVDAGHLYCLESVILSKRVHDLQVLLSNLADIPLDKQVLLTFEGRALDPKHSVYQYITTDRPLFLFSKSNIECHVVQSQSNLPRDPDLQEKLETYMKDGQNCDTLKSGADLATLYQKYSEEIYSRTKQLVQDQQLQRNGWAAVINNLDGVTAGFNRRVALFHDLYECFLKNKEHYGTMLVQFEEDVKVLSQIPLTEGILERMRSTNMLDSIRLTKNQGLGITESMRAPDPGASPGDHSATSVPGLGGPFEKPDKKPDFISLLHWIEAQDTQNSLTSLVMQCSRAMDQINQSFLPRVQEDVDKVKQDLSAPGMRDIRGLEERLQQLQNLLLQTEKICEEQAANATTIRSQQENFMSQGDISVLADLLLAHREQLQRLQTNNRTLIEYHTKFANAKVELCQNLLIRLTWVTHCQKSILSSDGRLTMICENLTRVKRRFAVLEQINISPRLYCMCLGEVARRNHFSKRYKSWAKGLISKVNTEKTRETELRTDFYRGLKGHFLMNLFRGLDSLPTELVAPDALSFDDDLFEVSEEEISHLSEMFPSYSSFIKELSETGDAPMKDAASQATLGSPSTTPTTPTTADTAVEDALARCQKLETELQGALERACGLAETNAQLEQKLAQVESEVAGARARVATLEDEGKSREVQLALLAEERGTFQRLACEKDTRISGLKTENETFKLQQRGWKNDKKELEGKVEELGGKVNEASQALSDKEEAMRSIQREVELLRSNQTVTEQHRQQLTNLRLEIEHKKDKEKTFELEKLRLEKDKVIQELERMAKMDRGKMEETIERASHENGKLTADLIRAQAEISELTAKMTKLAGSVDENKESLAMAKMESERDLKLLKSNAADEMKVLQEQFTRKIAEAEAAKAQAEAAAAKAEVARTTAEAAAAAAKKKPEVIDIEDSRPCATSSIEGGPEAGSSSGEGSLEARLRRLQLENQELRTIKSRCMEVAVTQFQKGDTVVFYYDEAKNNYLVASVVPNEYQYFLHPDNLSALDLSLEGANRKPWAIGTIKEKEFCQARKVNNRFRVPEGKKFYRVYAQQRTPAPSNEAS